MGWLPGVFIFYKDPPSRDLHKAGLLAAPGKHIVFEKETIAPTHIENASIFPSFKVIAEDNKTPASTKRRSQKYGVPLTDNTPDSVLQVIYLVFNEGYFPSSGDAPTRADLSSEALRLGRLLLSLLPEPEVAGLLALMLLTEARRAARTDAAGDPVLLDDQDRTLWDRVLIAEGEKLVEQALRSRRFGPYSLQAAIAAVHAEAARPEDTDWEQIVGLYDVLLRAAPSPVVALNRAVAVAMRDGPEAGLALIDGLLADGGLDGYYLARAARADLCRRAGRIEEARAGYREALALCQQGAQRAFLEKRLAALDVESAAR